MVRETGVQSSVESYQRLKKIVLGAALINTQYYEDTDKREKWSSSGNWVVPSPTIEKGSIG